VSGKGAVHFFLRNQRGGWCADDFRTSCSQTLSPLNRTMLIVHVNVQVKPEYIEAFKAATLANAQASVLEAGVARFDVVQQADDPSRFVLIEVYRDTAAPAAHKTTTHYGQWRDAVAPMMAAPRSSMKFSNIFPADHAW
jgi:(4S)-4-hydroxy-5-phosphonooxypentane-2,3-dione isomerase